MIVIEVYAETKTTRTHVGTLSRNKEGYLFYYADSWLKNPKAIEVGPDIPLSSEKTKSRMMPESFRSRIPKRDSTNYEEYCLERGIDLAEDDEMILLGHIGQKGASTFVFELSDEIERKAAAKKRLKQLLDELSLRDAAAFFGVSHTTIASIANETDESGPGYRYIETVLLVEEAFFYCLRTALGLTEDTRYWLRDIARRWGEERAPLEEIAGDLKLNPQDKSLRKKLAKWNYIRTGPTLDLARSRTQTQKMMWEKLMKKYRIPLTDRWQ